jgi:5-methylcytosine-specific restriction endonuclease McrA
VKSFNAFHQKLDCKATLGHQFCPVMSDVLHKATVLVLNRNWQAIDVKTPADAFCMMAAGTATALDIASGENMAPTKWAEWLDLPVRDSDNAVKTVHGPVRVPTVLVLAKYDKVPKRRPKLSGKGIWERDGGVCQYTGKKLSRDEGNIDHIVPRSRGGKTTWDNCVLADKRINSKKANHTPDEVGLKLQRKPITPREMPATYYIRNTHGVPDWEMFLD